MLTNEQYNQLFGDTQQQPSPNKPKQPQQQAASKPKPAAQPTSFLGKVADVAKGALSGIFKEGENTVQSVHDIANAVDNKFLGNKYVDDNTDYDLVPDALKPKTGVGKTAQTLSAFVAGWVGVGKFAKVVKGASVMQKLATSMPAASKVVGTVLRGGTVDFITGDASDERLSDTLVQNDIFRNGLTEYLASKPDDTAAEARWKNVLEGFATGELIDTAGKAFKFIKNGFHASAKADLAGAVAARKAGADVVMTPEATEVLNKATADKTWAKTTEQFTPKAMLAKNPDLILNDPDGYERALEKARSITDKTHFNSSHLDEPVRGLLQNADPTFADIADKAHMNLADVALKGFRNCRQMGVFENNDWRKVIDTAKTLDPREAVTTEAYYLSLGANKHISMACEQIADGIAEGPQNLRNAMEGAIATAADLKLRGMEAGQIGKSFDVMRLFKSADDIAKGIEKNGEKIADVANKAITTPEIDVNAIAKDALNGKTDEELVNIGKALNTTIQSGGADTYTILAQTLPDNHPLRQLLSTPADESLFQKGVDKAMAFRYVAMLSSIKTHVRNIMGNTLKIPLMSFESAVKNAVLGAQQGYVADGLSGSFVGALRGVKDGLGFSQGLAYGLPQAFDSFKTALKYGQAFSRTSEFGNAMVDLTKEAEQGTLSKVVNAPLRMLAAEDEFFASWIGTARSYQAAMIDLKKSGLLKGITDKQTLSDLTDKWLDDYMKRNAWIKTTVKMGDKTLEGGKALALQSAVDAANEVTYQQKLWGVFKGIDELANKYKFVKVIIPFTKTPTNIMLDTFYTRGIGAPYELAKAIKGGDWNQIATEAGHLTSAIALWSTAAYLVHNGLITGRGPDDKNERARLIDMGWQPSCFKVNGQYRTLQSVQPYGSALEFLATAMEKADRAGDSMLSPDGLGDVWNALTAVIGDQTFFKGISDFANSLSKGNQGDAMQQVALSFVPAIMRDLGRVNDPIKYQTPDFYAKVYDKWGLDDKMAHMAPQISWLTGEYKSVSEGIYSNLFSPFNTTQEQQSAVFSELSRANGIADPQKEIGNVKLNPRQYAEYCRTIGTLQLNGKTLYQALSDKINSDEYQNDIINNPDPTPYTLNESRNEELKRIVKQYRDAAKTKFMNDNPWLGKDNSIYAQPAADNEPDDSFYTLTEF